MTTKSNNTRHSDTRQLLLLLQQPPAVLAGSLFDVLGTNTLSKALAGVRTATCSTGKQRNSTHTQSAHEQVAQAADRTGTAIAWRHQLGSKQGGGSVCCARGSPGIVHAGTVAQTGSKDQGQLQPPDRGAGLAAGVLDAEAGRGCCCGCSLPWPDSSSTILIESGWVHSPRYATFAL
jgi:hypothetical protein